MHSSTLVAIIVGRVTPPIIVAGVAGLSEKDSIILIQDSACNVKRFPSRCNYFRLSEPVSSALDPDFRSSWVSVLPTCRRCRQLQENLELERSSALYRRWLRRNPVGLFVKQIRRFFPPLITGTVVFTIGLSRIRPPSTIWPAVQEANIRFMAELAGCIITLAIVTLLNHFGKGIFKLASILIGMICGYIVALFFA